MLAAGGFAPLTSVVLEKAKEMGYLHALLNDRDKYIGNRLCFAVRGGDKGRQAWHYVEVKRRLVDIFQKKTHGGTSVDVAIYGNVVKSGWGPESEQETKDMIDKLFEERLASNTTEPDQTPLHIALFKSHDAVAKLFIEAGASLTACDCFGLTPMHIACMRGNMELAKMLDIKGASLTAEDKDGKTPVEVAEDNEHTDLSKFIKPCCYIVKSEVRI